MRVPHNNRHTYCPHSLRVLFLTLTLGLTLLCGTSQADVATVYVAASGDDGYTYCQGTEFLPFYTWWHICSGTWGSKNANTSFGTIPVGARYTAAQTDFVFWRGRVRFDLSGLKGTVTTAELRVFIWRNSETLGSITVKRIADDWPIDSSDYGTGGVFIGSKAFPVSVGQYNHIAVNADTVTAHMGTGAYLCLGVGTTRIESCAGPQPTGNHFFDFYTYDFGSNQPYLYIEYTPPAVPPSGRRQPVVCVTGNVADAGSYYMGGVK